MTGKSGMLGSLLEQLGLASSPNAKSTPHRGGTPSHRPASSGPERSAELFDFQKRLGHVLLSYRDDAQGHVFILRLEGLKDKLGERWLKNQDQILGAIERIIGSHTGGGDLFIRYDDTSYLLIFLTQNQKEGQLRTAAIANEIAHRLVGAEGDASIVTPQSVRIGGEGEVVYQDLPPLKSLVENTVRSLAGGTETPTQSAAGGNAVDGRARPGTSPPASTANATVGQAPSLPDGLTFLYRPLLAVKTSVISTFLCIPSLDHGDGHFLSGYQVLHSQSNPLDIFALDQKTLQVCAAEIRDLTDKGGHSLIAVPVHFETLADTRRRSAYIALVDDWMAGYEKRIIFELKELPEGIPQNRLIDLVSALKPHSRSVIARFDPDHKNFDAFRVAGLHAVGIDLYNSGKSETELMALLEKFVTVAKKNQLRCYAEGIRTLSLFTIAMTLGFDYIAGHALTAVAKNAEEIQKFKLEEPYMAFLQALHAKPGAKATPLQ